MAGWMGGLMVLNAEEERRRGGMGNLHEPTIRPTRTHTTINIQTNQHSSTSKNKTQALDFRSPTGFPPSSSPVKDGDSAGVAEAGLLAALVVVRFVASGA